MRAQVFSLMLAYMVDLSKGELGLSMEELKQDTRCSQSYTMREFRLTYQVYTIFRQGLGELLDHMLVS